MRLRKHDIIRHRRFMDVAIMIRFAHINDDRIKFNGDWINMGFVETGPIGYRVKHRIKTEDIKDWYVCKEPHETCIRHTKWRKLS